MPDLVPVKRALLSVSDKSGLVEFAKALVDEFGVALLSTGGTAKALRDAGLRVTDVSEVTDFPEMMDGRVKTLHPKIHGGLLARLPEDETVMREHGIEPIDLVCVNLYPFEQTVAKAGVTYEEAIENIDIGGPSMVRSAAKNHARVLVVMDPSRYDKVLGDLRKHGGSSCFKHRQKMAAMALERTYEYDESIAHYLGQESGYSGDLPDHVSPSDPERASIRLRYGENPHQEAILLRYPPTSPEAAAGSIAFAEQHHGKELGYINVLDADAALNVVREFDVAACCVVKHATPCGVGIAMSTTRHDREGVRRPQGVSESGEAGDLEEWAAPVALPHGRASSSAASSFEHAYASDPLAAFGGVVALNRPVDLATAEAMADGQKFLEVIVASSFDDDALTLLKERWKNLRLLSVGTVRRVTTATAYTTSTMYREDWEIVPITGHVIIGGHLMQALDTVGVVETEWKVVSNRQPTDAEMAAMKFNWLVCKHVKSNAVVVGGEYGTYGIGGGQVDRVAAAEQAIKKAGERARGAVAASDAFFPFPDGPKALLDAGVTAIVQPGCSVKDQLTIDLVNERGATMVFTGRRHFRH